MDRRSFLMGATALVVAPTTPATFKPTVATATVSSGYALSRAEVKALMHSMAYGGGVAFDYDPTRGSRLDLMNVDLRAVQDRVYANLAAYKSDPYDINL